MVAMRSEAMSARLTINLTDNLIKYAKRSIDMGVKIGEVMGFICTYLIPAVEDHHDADTVRHHITGCVGTDGGMEISVSCWTGPDAERRCIASAHWYHDGVNSDRFALTAVHGEFQHNCDVQLN